jgi:meso-butanediol dehydrogenase/(S,S)-butanediol dehydrogenase/diacetyl reductase
MGVDAGGVFSRCRARSRIGEDRGAIVNTTSVSGTGGDWGMRPDNAAGGAKANLTRTLALHRAERASA